MNNRFTISGKKRREAVEEAFANMMCREDFEDQMAFLEDSLDQNASGNQAEILCRRYGEALNLNPEDLADLYFDYMDQEPEAAAEYLEVMSALPSRTILVDRLLEQLYASFQEYPTASNYMERLIQDIQRIRSQDPSENPPGAESILPGDTLRVKILKGFWENIDTDDAIEEKIYHSLDPERKAKADEFRDLLKNRKNMTAKNLLMYRRILAGGITDEIFGNLNADFSAGELLEIISNCTCTTQKCLKKAAENSVCKKDHEDYETIQAILNSLDVYRMLYYMAGRILEALNEEVLRDNHRDTTGIMVEALSKMSGVPESLMQAAQELNSYMQWEKRARKLVKAAYAKTASDKKKKDVLDQLNGMLVNGIVSGKCWTMMPPTFCEAEEKILAICKGRIEEFCHVTGSFLAAQMEHEDDTLEALLAIVRILDGRDATMSEDLEGLLAERKTLQMLQNIVDADGSNERSENLLTILKERSDRLTLAQAEELWNLYDRLMAVLMHLDRYCPILTEFKKKEYRKYQFKKKRDEKERSKLASFRWLKIADELSRGILENNYQTKEFLYYFAIAFGMKAYISTELDVDEIPGYCRELDLEEKLFFEYYQDNICRYLAGDQNGQDGEPSGDGINYKNHREVIYLYVLHREDLLPVERMRMADRMIRKVEKLAKERDQKEAEASVKLRRDWQTFDYKAVFQGDLERHANSSEDENALTDWILHNYTIREIVGNHVVPGISVEQNARTAQSFCEEEKQLIMSRYFDSMEVSARTIEEAYNEQKNSMKRKMHESTQSFRERMERVELRARRKRIEFQTEAASISMRLGLIDLLIEKYKDMDPAFVRAIQRLNDHLEAPLKDIRLELWRQENTQEESENENLFVTRTEFLAYRVQHYLLDLYDEEGAGHAIGELYSNFKEEVDMDLDTCRYQKLNEKNLLDMYLAFAIYYDYAIDRFAKEKKRDALYGRLENDYEGTHISEGE